MLLQFVRRAFLRLACFMMGSAQMYGMSRPGSLAAMVTGFRCGAARFGAVRGYVSPCSLGFVFLCPGLPSTTVAQARSSQQTWSHQLPPSHVMACTDLTPTAHARTHTTTHTHTHTHAPLADIGFFVNPSPEFGTGGYTLRYLNTLIACQAYPDPVPTCPSLAADITQPPPAPYTCLASVYDPASQRALCPTCACINGCRRGCDAAGLSGPTTAAC